MLISSQVGEVHLNGQHGVGLQRIHSAAQLSVSVVAPGPNSTVSTQRQGELLAGSDHGGHNVHRVGVIVGDYIYVVNHALVAGSEHDMCKAVAHAMDHEALLILQQIHSGM